MIVRQAESEDLIAGRFVEKFSENVENEQQFLKRMQRLAKKFPKWKIFLQRFSLKKFLVVVKIPLKPAIEDIWEGSEFLEERYVVDWN